MKPIKLEDLTPAGAEFTLSKTGKTYRLRPFNLADEAWLQRTFGKEIERIFKEMRMREICRIVFHQIEEEDKVDFAKKEITFMNEDGDTKTHSVGGADLLALQILGTGEKMNLFFALMQTIGISRQMVEEISESVATTTDAEKKSLNQFSAIGASSLTDSLPNTDGQPNTYGLELSEK